MTQEEIERAERAVLNRLRRSENQTVQPTTILEGDLDFEGPYGTIPQAITYRAVQNLIAERRVILTPDNVLRITDA